MKQIKIAAAILALVCVSCQKEASLIDQEANGSEDLVSVFRAETEHYDTKTSSNQQGYILWNAGDLVSIFEGSTTNAKYEVSAKSAGSTSADLVRVSGGGFVAGTELDANVAFYPYTSSNTVLKNGDLYEINYSLPQVQHYVPGSVGNDSFPMVAVTADTEDQTLSFKNVLGCLKIQLKGNAVIKSISFSNPSRPFGGPAKVSASNTAVPEVRMQSGSVKIVSLDCGEGVQLNTETATSFMIALPPATYTNGFSVEIEDADGNHMIQSTRLSQTINRSEILAMPELVVMQPEVQSVDLGLTSGILWSSHNIGAIRPEDRGNFYAWGETVTLGEVDMSNLSNYKFNQTNYPDRLYIKNAFQGNTYKHLKEGFTNPNKDINKYSWDDGYTGTYWNPAGSFMGDGKTVLDPEDDAAVVNWGNGWRMPTREEIQELLNECVITTTTSGNVLVCEFTGPNGNSIVIPTGGYMTNTAVNSSSGYGVWSSSLYVIDRAVEKLPVYSYYAAYLNMTPSVKKVNYFSRFNGLPVRPVRNN